MRLTFTLRWKRRGREVRLRLDLDLWKLVAVGALLAALLH
jgi:hypothetical protein